MSKYFEEFKKMSPQNQVKVLRLLDNMYYEKDNPLVSDEEYDACLKYYNDNNEEKYCSSLGKPGNEYKKYKHSYPVLSLGKTTTLKEVNEWSKKFNYDLVIEPKVDGLTVVYYPDGTLVSRGDGHVGEVLNNAKFIPNLPRPLTEPVRMEVCIDKETFNKYFSHNKKNARNTAAGILRRKFYDDDIKHLSYYAYNILGSKLSEEEQLELLKNHNYKTVEYKKCGDKKSLNDLYDDFYIFANSQPYPIDGIVIKCNDKKLATSFDTTAHHPNNMFAYKFATEYKKTILRAIVWNRGRTCFTPVAEFDPVTLGGNVISRASLHNLNIIKKLKVKAGKTVSVTLKNEIIPQIISCDNDTFTDKDFEEIRNTIKKCPYCGKDTVVTGKSFEVECTNSECPYRIYNDTQRLVEKKALNIEGISDIFCNHFADYCLKNNIKDSFYLFSLTDNELKELSGFTDYMTTKIKAEIDKAKKDVDPARFLYACNIPNVGYNTAYVIMDYFENDIKKFQRNFAENCKNIHGVGSVIADSIINNMDSVKEKAEYISNFTEYETNKDINLKKLKICITGKLAEPRKHYEELIEKNGHIFVSIVTKDTDYLICNNDSTNSSKYSKAKKLNIPIIPENKLNDILNK